MMLNALLLLVQLTAASPDLHAELTRALLERAAATDAERAALIDQLWSRYAAHHTDIDASNAHQRQAFRRSAARILELNALAAAASHAHRATYGFTRMAVLDERRFAQRLSEWRPMPHGGNATAINGSIESSLRPLGSSARVGELPRLSSPLGGALPATFDWSGRGVLSSVKDQHDCGACWSFTTVQTLESAVAVIGGALVTLSAQQLLDCDTSWNQGCVGGNVAASVGYLRKFGALREEDYPYHNSAGEACAYRPELVAVRVGELMRIPPGSEAQLQHALIQFGPLAVSVDASGWQHYAGGVISQCADGGVNHAVQLVGWGTTSNGVDYWNLRNSWSTSWGELGYARLLRGVGCNGIIDEPAYTFAIAGQECIALDCGHCVSDTPRCGWCKGSGRCLSFASGERACARGWLDATCPPTPPPPRGLSRAYTCGTAAAAATGQPAPYLAVRVDRIDWRDGSACVLGFELSATQAVGVGLGLLTVLCWLLQMLAGCCPSDEPDFHRTRRRALAGGAAGSGAAVPLLLHNGPGQQMLRPVPDNAKLYYVYPAHGCAAGTHAGDELQPVLAVAVPVRPGSKSVGLSG